MTAFSEKIPLLILSAAAGIVTFVLQNALLARSLRCRFFWRAENAVMSYVIYAWKTLWPTRLAVFILIQMILWQLGRLLSRLHSSSPSLVRQSFRENDLICYRLVLVPCYAGSSDWACSGW
ncbi:MAG: hypothetical protein Udaeo2_33500 [Candidatus Udaeobacter sp.]|nr:MAG: hypothetical protein Udaeo2_33500 [Candidatus Udaeobacter sp.]